MTVEHVTFGGDSGISDAERRRIGEAIGETDWEETSVLDVVKYRQVAKTDDPPVAEYEVHRHAERLPEYSEYADGKRQHRVFRITEEICAQEGIDPETGETDPVTEE